jgi:hypothetical protein
VGWLALKAPFFDSVSFPQASGLIPLVARLHLVSLVTFRRRFLCHTLTTSLFRLPNNTRCFLAFFHSGCLLSLIACLHFATHIPHSRFRQTGRPCRCPIICCSPPLSLTTSLSLAASISRCLCRLPSVSSISFFQHVSPFTGVFSFLHLTLTTLPSASPSSPTTCVASRLSTVAPHLCISTRTPPHSHLRCTG